MLGYNKRGDGKTWEAKQDYYTRMAGYVALYAALLQQSTCSHFAPPAEEMQTRAVANPLGVRAAWRSTASRSVEPPRRPMSVCMETIPMAVIVTTPCPSW